MHSFVLILTAMLLLLLQDKWVMEWTIKGHSSMWDYGLSSCFLKLFQSALPLAKKYVVLAAVDCASSTPHDWDSGKDFKKVISEDLRSGAWSLRGRLKSTLHHLSVSTQVRNERHYSCQRRRNQRNQGRKFFLDWNGISTTQGIPSIYHFIQKSIQCRNIDVSVKNCYYEQEIDGFSQWILIQDRHWHYKCTWRGNN